MDYRFNYGGMKAWMEANPDYSNRQVALKLGFVDVSSFRRWLSGDSAIPTEHLLKFCNTFQVPLEWFFFDNDAVPRLQLKASGINDQTEPNGGYTQRNKKGGPHRPSPIATERIVSNVPGMENTESRDDETTEVRNDEGTEMRNGGNTPADITQLFLAYQQALAEMQQEHIKREDEIRDKYETKWDKERDELMTIIRSQRAEIDKMRRSNYRLGMVGEEDPRPTDPPLPSR